jgi:ketosteroid isomerase-like protein
MFDDSATQGSGTQTFQSVCPAELSSAAQRKESGQNVRLAHRPRACVPFTAISRALTLAIWILITMQPSAQARSVAEDEKAVEALDIEYQAAVKQNDVATMDRILANDFVLVTGLGKTYAKTDLLEEARSKRTVYEHQEDSARKVRVWGDTAVVTALLWAKGTEDGKAFDYKLWFSDTYVRTPTGWRYAFAQASTRLPATL